MGLRRVKIKWVYELREKGIFGKGDKAKVIAEGQLRDVIKLLETALVAVKSYDDALNSRWIKS